MLNEIFAVSNFYKYRKNLTSFAYSPCANMSGGIFKQYNQIILQHSGNIKMERNNTKFRSISESVF